MGVGSLNEPTAKFYALQILYALRYFRQNGIIHRDLKPDNVLITSEGKLKLTDFGLSFIGMVDRHVNSPQNSSNDAEIRTAASVVGTPDYIAPEIILGQNHTFTVDYWSLGVMIYEFLFGVPPFHASDEKETNKRILVGRFDFDPEVPISKEARDLIQKLLIVEPENRLGYYNIDEIINHPWFSGVDPINDDPPFKPELSDKFDTTYFEQRYEFNDNEDASILADLRDCIQPTSTFPDDDISPFSSIALDQLGNQNLEIASKFERSNSLPSSQIPTNLDKINSLEKILPDIPRPSNSTQLQNILLPKKREHNSVCRMNSATFTIKKDSNPSKNASSSKSHHKHND